MKKSILIVDDDREMCEEISEILADEGYDVDMRHDGRSGAEIIDKKDFDVILLDLKIPLKNGIEVLKDTKKTKPRAKVLVITGRPFNSELHAEGNTAYEKDREIFHISRNADGFLNKPYDVKELINRINSLTGQHPHKTEKSQ